MPGSREVITPPLALDSGVISLISRSVVVKVTVRILDIAFLHDETSSQIRSGMARVVEGSYSFIPATMAITRLSMNEPRLWPACASPTKDPDG